MNRASKRLLTCLGLAALCLGLSGCSTTQTAAGLRALKPHEAEELLALQAARTKPAEGHLITDPARVEAHADGLARQGQWSAALYQYGRALTLAEEADKPRLRAKVGEASLKAGMFAPAEAVFAELIKTSPREASLWQGLGLARFGQGQLDQARADLTQAVALDPGLWRAQNALGIVHNRQGRPGEALPCFRAALQARPDLPALYNNLALSHILRQEWPQAEAQLRQALRIAPDYALAANNLGLVLAKQGRDREALRVFAAAEGQAGAHNNLGVVMTWRGQYDQAARHFRQAVDAMPRFYPLADRHLEQIEERLGRPPDQSSAPLADPASARGGWPVLERGAAPEERPAVVQPRFPAPPAFAPPAEPSPPPQPTAAPGPVSFHSEPAVLAPPVKPAALAFQRAPIRTASLKDSSLEKSRALAATLAVDERRPASLAYRDRSRQLRQSLPEGFVGFVAEKHEAHLVKGVIVGQDGGLDRLEGNGGRLAQGVAVGPGGEAGESYPAYPVDGGKVYRGTIGAGQ